MIRSTSRTITTLEEWITDQYLVDNADESLWLDSGTSWHLIGRRIIRWSDYDADRFEIDTYRSADDAAERFATYVGPTEYDVFIGYNTYSGYFVNPGDLGKHELFRGPNNRFDSLRRAMAAIRIAMHDTGVYPAVWFDYSYGRGTGYYLVDRQARQMPESPTLHYVY